MSARRYTRQVRLPEVGQAGQARLEAKEPLALSTAGDAARIERAYLEAAGARVRARDAGAVTDGALPFEVRDAAARDVAEGAHAALVALRRVWLSEAAS